MELGRRDGEVANLKNRRALHGQELGTRMLGSGKRMQLSQSKLRSLTVRKLLGHGRYSGSV